MAHACSSRSVAGQPENQATVYIDDGTNGMAGTGTAGTVEIGIPEDTFGPADGFPTTIRFVGPGNSFASGFVVDIDPDI